jgi:hypothetical protein
MQIVTCSKCNGTGRFHYQSGMIGQCYNCDGIGQIKQTEQKQYSISIVDTNGNRIEWIHVEAKTEKAAIKKAETIALKGVYKDNTNTIQAIDEGTVYKYSKIKK